MTAFEGNVVIMLTLTALSFGYDGYTSCSRPYRTSKARPEPPCEFQRQSWCTIPGSAYPWHAVRRFVHENQGLMRRMYGEQRHISVLRAEIESNDVEYLRENDWKVTTVTENSVPTEEQNITRHFNVTTVNNFTEFQRTSSTTTVPSIMDVFNSTKNDTLPWASTTVEDDIASTSPESTIVPVDDTYMTEPTVANDDDITTTQTEKPTESQLFQDVKHNFEKGEDSSQSTPVGLFKLRGVNACPVKEEVVAPFWANNTRGEVLALLNLYPFEQYVHWEKCTFEHKQMFCREGCRCEQQYRLHRLLAYDPNNECRGIFSDWFKFPSCCVCRCYDLPVEFQITSRSPRLHSTMWNLYDSAAPDQHSQTTGG